MRCFIVTTCTSKVRTPVLSLGPLPSSSRPQWPSLGTSLSLRHRQDPRGPLEVGTKPKTIRTWQTERWLHSFKGNSLKTWDEVVEKFLKKYFLESKTAEGKAAISSFHQFQDESLSEALERFCGLLRKTPTLGFSEPIQLNIFIDGLRP